MKKLLLSLGAVVAIAFPVAAMVTCRTGNSSYGVSESDALKSSKTLLIAMIDSPIYSNLTPDQKANFIKRIHNANEDELQNISDDFNEAIGAGTNNQDLIKNPIIDGTVKSSLPVGTEELDSNMDTNSLNNGNTMGINTLQKADSSLGLSLENKLITLGKNIEKSVSYDRDTKTLTVDITTPAGNDVQHIYKIKPSDV